MLLEAVALDLIGVEVGVMKVASFSESESGISVDWMSFWQLELSILEFFWFSAKILLRSDIIS